MNNAFSITRIEKHLHKEFVKNSLEDILKAIADKLDEQQRQLEEKDKAIARMIEASNEPK
jgi:hypothetical protein